MIHLIMDDCDLCEKIEEKYGLGFDALCPWGNELLLEIEKERRNIKHHLLDLERGGPRKYITRYSLTNTNHIVLEFNDYCAMSTRTITDEEAQQFVKEMVASYPAA